MTPRCGSELLCEALAATGVAGKPTEHFWNFDGIDYPARHGVATNREALQKIYAAGSSANGVFGVKLGFDGEFFPQVLAMLRDAWSLPGSLAANDVLQEAFPGLRVIMVTRRNKVRQAVSWWRAIQSDVWHVWQSRPSAAPKQDAVYNFDAIDHLVQELILREAAQQEFLQTYSGPPAMSIVYEDFVPNYAPTVQRCLDHLGLKPSQPLPARPDLMRQADRTNEEWVQRYKDEKQSAWSNRQWL